MEILLDLILPIILYTLGAVLLTFLIIISYKFLKALNNVNNILEDAYKKTQSLNGMFNAIDVVTDKISVVSDTLTDKLTEFIMGIFKKKIKKKKVEEEE